MPDYKIYPLDEVGHISIATALRCAGDAEALAFASLIPGLSAEVEVREGGRYVGRVRIKLASTNKGGCEPAHRQPDWSEPVRRKSGWREADRHELGRPAASTPVQPAASLVASS